MAIKEALLSCVREVKFETEKHSPEILFGIGCIGVVATAVTAFRAYPRADFVLMMHKTKMNNVKKATEVATPEDRYNPAVDKLKVCGETAKDMVATFGPSVLLGVGTIVSFGAAFKILNTRYVGAVAWGSAVADTFSLYRSRVKNELGEDADRHFRYGTGYNVHIEPVKDADGNIVGEQSHLTYDIPDTEDEDATSIENLNPKDIARYFDESNDNWDPNPTFNLMFLRGQEQMADDKLQADGHLFLNDVYDMLGFKHTSLGAVIGWMKGPGVKVDFGLGNREADSVRKFINGDRSVVPLEFNVTGVIWHKI